MKHKLIILFLFIFQNLHAGEIFGIAKVIDGDTIKISKQNIRLIFIDAPEIAQKCFTKEKKIYYCGNESKEFLKSIINNKRVYCEYKKKDKYRRVLAECFLTKKKLYRINYKMVENGWAIIYRRYSFPKNYLIAEDYAKKTNIGIWQGKFISPEIWRIKNK